MRSVKRDMLYYKTKTIYFEMKTTLAESDFVGVVFLMQLKHNRSILEIKNVYPCREHL